MKLEGEEELTQEQKKGVTNLTDMWDLPRITADNQLYSTAAAACCKDQIKTIIINWVIL